MTRGLTLPARYAEDAWTQPFFDEIQPSLIPGVAILDIGSGRRPTLPVASRPPSCRYVGLDLSSTELALAPTGSYDRALVGDVVEHRRELDGEFDLVVSWQVLEHVKPLADALENIRSYLRPGGRFVGQLSGTFSLFGLVNAVIPHWAATWTMQRLLGRDPDTVFPAHYDRCWYSALTELGETWSSFVVYARHQGAGYFRFSRALQKLYLKYEDWVIEKGHSNLATHYLIVGQR